MIVVLVGNPICNAIVLLVGFGTVFVRTNVGSQISEYMTPAISKSLVFHLTVVSIQVKLTSKLNRR